MKSIRIMFFTKPINLRFNPPVTWASIKETRKLYVLCVSIELQKNFFLPYFDGHCRLKWNNVRFSQKWKKNFRMNFDIVRNVLKTILTWNGLTGYAKRRLFSGNFRHRIKRTVSLERISAILCGDCRSVRVIFSTFQAWGERKSNQMSNKSV